MQPSVSKCCSWAAVSVAARRLTAWSWPSPNIKMIGWQDRDAGLDGRDAAGKGPPSSLHLQISETATI